MARKQLTSTHDVPLLEDDDPQASLPFSESPRSKVAEPSRAQRSADVAENEDGSAMVALDDAPADPDVEELEDGSVMIYDEEESAERPQSEDFLENLAESLDPVVVNRMGRDLLEAIKRDKEDRKERDDQYAEGIKRTGLGNEAPGGADFSGASRVVHPLLAEGCIDFAARVMKEVFPPKGPVKSHVVGKANREKLERAERKKTYMNWQCTKQIREFRGTIEQMLTQVPLGGSQYVKMYRDERLKRARVEFIPVDKLHLPSSAVDLWSAPRKSHEQNITQSEYDSRVRVGLYREVTEVGASGSTPEKTDAQTASDKIEGVTDSSQNEDGVRTIYESYVMLELEGDKKAPGSGRLVPYIVSVDEVSGQVLSIYRNWAEDDELFQELDWIVEYKFLPWRGAMGIGLLHLIGSLSAAATGALRALLDKAHIENFPGAIKLKGARMSGQNTTVNPTQITEIEGPTGIDDIRKLAMPLPFGSTSPVLFQLLEYVVQAGKGAVSTAEEKIADVTANAPVGTTLAVIEQGSINYSSIHSRMHASMERQLAILHRIDAMYIDDEETVEELGELTVRREDFVGPMDVVPVSDPNIFSETQRYAQLQAALQLRTQFAPGSFKDNTLLERALQLLSFPGYEDVVNTPLEAEERNAVDENAVAADPQSTLEVYEGQDNLAHMQAHLTFMASPIFCANPLMAPIALPKLMEHVKKHMLAYYQENVRAAAQAMAQQAAMFSEIRDVDTLLSAASGVADKQMAQELGPIMQSLQQLQQQMAQLIPPPPSPEVAVEQMRAQAAQAIEQVRAQTAQAVEQVRQQGASEREQAKVQAKMQIDGAKMQAESTQHTEEMAASARNAQIAEESERQRQASQAQIAAMQEEGRRMAAEMQTETQRFIAELNAANQRAIEAIRQENAQNLEKMRLETQETIAKEMAKAKAATPPKSGE